MATTTIVSTRDEWSSPSFWRELAPALNIESPDLLASTTLFTMSPDGMQMLQSLIRKEGYFQLPPADWELPVAEMASIIGRLDAAGIPVPFAFVYDEFWLMFIKVHSMLEPLLGPGYLRLPNFWAWFVDPRRGDGGWAPHRDKGGDSLRDDGSPTAVTVWVPLTHATTLNGCMYVVPADRDLTYNTPDYEQFNFDYQDVRALPAAAGSILIWNHALLHWGARGSERESQPRISVACEFQSADVPPAATPVLAPTTVPHFNIRLRLIAKQILQYKHMYPLAPEIEAIAQRLLAGENAR